MFRPLLPLVMALVVGCGAPTPPPAAAPAGPSAAEKAAELGYKVSWPAEPSFARSAFTSAFGKVDSEDATAIGPGMVRFGVGVQKYQDNAVFTKPPREALGEVLKQFEKLLVNAKSTDREFEPKKLPAVELTGEAAGQARRQLVVLSGRDLYTVSVTAGTPDRVSGPDADAFLNSFGLTR